MSCSRPTPLMNFAKHVADAEEWVDRPRAPRRVRRSRRPARTSTTRCSASSTRSTRSSRRTARRPFTSVGFGLGTGWYEREIQRRSCRHPHRGLGKEGRTAIFPKLLFTVKRGPEPRAGRPQLRHQVTRGRVRHQAHVPRRAELRQDRRDSPAPSRRRWAAAHSCRAGKTSDGNDVVEGRMNLGVVTLNLPRIALEARGQHRGVLGAP